MRYVRYALLLSVVFAQGLSLSQVSPSPRSNTQMEMQVILSFDDGTALQGESESTNANGTAGVESANRNRGPGAHSRDIASNMQIRVQLQDGFGSTLQEHFPNSEGRVSFIVKSQEVYRVRVFGPAIDETWVERVEPGRGDRIVNVTLHRKGSDNPVITNASAAAMTPIIRLHVPPKAQEAATHGSRALAGGDLKAARKSFEKAIKIYPDFDLAYNNLGVVLMKMGEKEAGRNAFTKAVELNEHFARAYLNLASIALDEKDFVNADRYLRKSLGNDPLNAHALLMAAQAAFVTRKYADVVTDVRTLHSLDHRQYALGHYIAGMALEAEQLPKEAAIEYQLFITEAPNDPNTKRARQRVNVLSDKPTN